MIENAPSTYPRKLLAFIPLFCLGCVVLHAKLGSVEQPAMNMMVLQTMQPLKMRAQQAEARAVKAAAAGIHAQSLSGHAAAGKAWTYASAIGWAARDGAQVGCRGSL